MRERMLGKALTQVGISDVRDGVETTCGTRAGELSRRRARRTRDCKV